MSRQKRTIALRFVATAAILAIALPACVSSFFTSGSGFADLSVFRIENATGGAVDVRIEILDQQGNPVDARSATAPVDIPVVIITPGSVQFSTLQPIGGAAGDQGQSAGNESESLLFGPDATARVTGFDVTQGGMACGAVIRLTTTITSSSTAVQYTGDGSGTPGFDSGSVGQSGERFLIEGVDFSCGDKVVVRVDSDGSSGGSAASGRVAVVALDAESPFGTIGGGEGTSGGDAGGGDTGDGEDTGGGGDGGGNGDSVSSTTVLVQVQNQASITAEVDLEVATVAGTVDTLTVRVQPEILTEGEFACGSQITFTGRLISTERAPNTDPSAEFPDAIVVLTGDGTGSPGFDEASVAAGGERILVEGTHYNCGDTILVSIDDDSAVATANGFNPLGLGAGAVDVLGDGSGTGGDTGTDGESLPDVQVDVDNQTTAFVRINVVSGASSLGRQLDIVVPGSGQSVGATSCADRLTVSALSLAPEALTGLLDAVLIVLTGDGTGTAGFDEGSVGVTGSRLLLESVHYECGDSLTVTITDAGAVGFPEPDIIDTNGVVIGFNDITGNGIQDDVPDRLGTGTVGVD